MFSQPIDDNNIFLSNHSSSPSSDLYDLDPSYPESTSSKKSGKWTPEEDDLLRRYAPLYGERQWRKISDKIPGRTSIQCLHRWTKILKPGLVKGPWTPEEDQKLFCWVKANGASKWAQAAKLIQGRSGKQCRERWFNNLSPDVKKGEWTKDEDEQIFKLYQQYGSSWSQIAKFIIGRTENAIKNRFYSTLRRLATAKKRKIAKKGQDGRMEEEIFTGDIRKDSPVLESILEKEDDECEGFEFLEKPANNLFKLLQETSTAPASYTDVGQDLNDYEVKKKVKKNNYGTPIYAYNRKETSSTIFQDPSTKQVSEETDKEFENFLAGFDMISPIAAVESGEKPYIDLNTDAYFDPQENYAFQNHHHQQQPVVKSAMISQQINNYQTSTPSNFQFSSSQKSLIPAKPVEFAFRNEMSPPHGGYMQSSSNTYESVQYASAYPTNNTNNSGNVLHSATMAVQKLMKECSEDAGRGIDRITNLVDLLRNVVEQVLPSLIDSADQFSGPYCFGAKDRRADKRPIKGVLSDLQKVIGIVSNVHYNYTKSLLEIVKNCPKESSGAINERMNYIFGQLSTFDNLISSAKTQIRKLEMTVSFPDDLSTDSEDGRHEGLHQEILNDNYQYKKNSITIRLGSLNSGLEEISKKRVLNY